MTSTFKRRLNVTVNGKSYLVEVGDLYGSPISVTVNGQPYVVDIKPSGVEQVASGESAAALEQVARRDPVPKKAPTLKSPASGTAKEVTAPMPGNIIEIAVKPGQQVSAGQELCSLEAMKMKNAIRSPHAGVVATVDVAVGQAVAHGDVLLTFE